MLPLHQATPARPASPAVATAQQLQERLPPAYRSIAEIRSHRGVALLLLGRDLRVWVYRDRVEWDNGLTDVATGKKCYSRMPADQVDQAASLIVARFCRLRAGQD